MDIRVNEEHRLLLAYPSRVFDMKMAEEIVQFIEAWEVKHQEGYDRLCDTTRLDAIHLSTAEIREIALRRRLFNANPVRVRTAFLADTPLAFGIVAMYAAFYEGVQSSPRISMRSFRSINDAANWLGIDPEEVLCSGVPCPAP